MTYDIIIPYDSITHNIIACHLNSYHVMSFRLVYYIRFPCLVQLITHHIASRHVTSHHITPHLIISHVALHHVIIHDSIVFVPCRLHVLVCVICDMPCYMSDDVCPAVYVIPTGWSNNHVNKLHFIISFETA